MLEKKNVNFRENVSIVNFLILDRMYNCLLYFLFPGYKVKNKLLIFRMQSPTLTGKNINH